MDKTKLLIPESIVSGGGKRERERERERVISPEEREIVLYHV